MRIISRITLMTTCVLVRGLLCCSNSPVGQARVAYRRLAEPQSRVGVYVEPSSLSNGPLAPARREASSSDGPEAVTVEVAFPPHNSMVSWDVAGVSPYVIVVVGPRVPSDAQLCVQIRMFPSASGMLEYACADVSRGRFTLNGHVYGGQLSYELTEAEDGDTRGVHLMTPTNFVMIKPIRTAFLSGGSLQPKYAVVKLTLLVDGEPLASTRTQFISQNSFARMVRSPTSSRVALPLPLAIAFSCAATDVLDVARGGVAAQRQDLELR